MEKPVRAAALLATIAMGIACTACTGDASSPAAALPTRSSTAVSSTPSSAGASSTPSSAADDVPPPPKVGQCRNTPATRLAHFGASRRPGDWVDKSPVVDCSKTHTMETIEVIKPVVKLTLALAEQLGDSCATPAAINYLGTPDRGISRIAYPLLYWPSPAQRAAGQKWVRCDIGVQATTQCCAPLAPQTASLHGKVGADQGRFQICIGELPDPARSQRLTSCKRPHRAELFPTPLELNPAKYPPAAVLERTGRSGCADMVKDREDAEGLVAAAYWVPKSQWSGGTLFAQCWITRKVGLLPPIE